MSVWYHGGYPGLRPGELVEPPDTTGTNHTLSRYVPAGAPHGTRTDVVYITSSKTVARVYAAWYPDGAVYLVEPYGDLEPDPDAPELGGPCAGAPASPLSCTPRSSTRTVRRSRGSRCWTVPGERRAHQRG